MEFDIPEVQELLQMAPPPSLGPGQPYPELSALLDKLSPEQLFPGRKIGNPQSAACCHAALHLLNNELDPAHKICQAIPTPEGSFWHGIVHRREGDYGNAKYWFSRVGPHPVFDDLTREFGENFGDPGSFVDKVASLSPDDSDAITIQSKEWEFLFRYGYQGALIP
jgi:hypothetical protein